MFEQIIYLIKYQGGRVLEKTDPNIYTIDEKVNTVFQLAIMHGRPFKELKQFVEKFQIDIHHKNTSGETCLILDAQRGISELTISEKRT